MNNLPFTPNTGLFGKYRSTVVGMCLLFSGLLICAPAAWSADVLKANNTNALNLGSSWSGSVAPTGSDVGVWTDTVVGANSTVLGADLSWSGIRISGTDAGLVTISAGNKLTLGSAGIDLSSSSRNLVISSTLALGANQNWNIGTGRTLTVSTVGISGTGNFNKTGAGVFNSSNVPNTFTGTFTLTAGTLKSTNTFSSAGNLVLKGGTRVENGSTAASTITLSGNSQVTHLDGNVTFVGTTGGTSDTTRLVFGRSGSPAMNLRANVEFNVENATVGPSGIGGRVEVSGFSDDGLGRSLTKTGIGMLRLTSNTSTHTGGTFINAGILDLSGGSGSRLGTSNVTVQGGTLNVSTASSNQAMGVLTLASGSITGSSGAVPFFASSVVLQSGQVSHTLAGSGTVTKNTAGTVTMSGTHLYTGATTINAGTLLINGSTAAGSAVTVEAAGILGGSGTINGATTINGSLRPGNSIGELTVANDVTWNGGVDWVFELGTADASDRLSITGGNDFLRGTGSDWRFDLGGSSDLGTFTLVQWDGITTFDLIDFSYTNLGGGHTGEFGFAGNSLVFTVVPEPGTWMLLTLGLIVLTFSRRARHLRGVAQ